jgi:dCTP deaminase
MSLLTHDAIIGEITRGTIMIEPRLDPEQIRQASIDLRLGNVFRIFEKSDQPIAIREATNYQDFTKEIIAEEITLHPQETVLGVTVEKITLPNNMVGWLEGRSRFARLGLLIHISAGLIQPGVSNKQVLEITNLSPNVMTLFAGEKICQLAFQRTEGSANYEGQFEGQVKP